LALATRSLSATLSSHGDRSLRGGPLLGHPGRVPLGCPRVLSPRTDCLRVQLGDLVALALFVPHLCSHHGSRAATNSTRQRRQSCPEPAECPKLLRPEGRVPIMSVAAWLWLHFVCRSGRAVESTSLWLAFGRLHSSYPCSDFVPDRDRFAAWSADGWRRAVPYHQSGGVAGVVMGKAGCKPALHL
jgi:hypothetical protein